MGDRLTFWTHPRIHTFSTAASPAHVHSQLSWREGGLDSGQFGSLGAALLTVNEDGDSFGFQKGGQGGTAGSGCKKRLNTHWRFVKVASK